MKKLNIPRITWITCLFLCLIIILIMVVDYKINYQYMTSSSLYFYDCNDNLCVSETTSSNKIYSTYSCGSLSCPVYQKKIEDDYAILKYSDNAVLFNFKEGKTVSKGYDDYSFINSSYIIVTKNKNKGIIDLNDNLTVKLLYEEIGEKNQEQDYVTGYNSNNIIAKRNDKYGIISYKDGKITEEFKYDAKDKETLLNIIKKDSEVSI